MSSKFSLLVSMPDEGPVAHELDGDSISLGRGPDNVIQVLIAEVSVKHGELKADGDGFKIVDLGSTNGTLLNGAQVGGEGSALSPMDKVLLGATVSAYFVPTAVLAATPPEELIASIEASPKSTPTPGTAKVAVAAPVAQPAPGVPVARPAVALPVKPGALTPAVAGAATVKLEQVRPGPPAPGPARPPGVAPAAPAPPRPVGGPPAPGAAPVAPPRPAGGPPAPQPVSPVPLKRPGSDGAPAAPSVPLPGPPRVKLD